MQPANGGSLPSYVLPALPGADRVAAFGFRSRGRKGRFGPFGAGGDCWQMQSGAWGGRGPPTGCKSVVVDKVPAGGTYIGQGTFQVRARVLADYVVADAP